MQLQELFTQEEIQLLQTRAERVAAPLQEGDGAGQITALVAIVQREEYALPIAAITAVYQGVAIIPVPCVPEFVAGIANVRGHLVSVLDLGTLLGVQGQSDTTGSALVVADVGDTNIGFRVEAIGEVLELELSQMNPVPANMNLAQAQYLRGVFPDGTALLDIKAVLNDPRLLVDESTS